MTPKVHLKLTSRSTGLLDLRHDRPSGIDYSKKAEEFTTQERSMLVFLSIVGRACDEYNNKIINGATNDVPTEDDRSGLRNLPDNGPALDGVSPTEFSSEVGGVQLED